MASNRYFHVSFLTGEEVGFQTFVSKGFPNLDKVAEIAGAEDGRFVLLSLFEFRSVDDFEAFTGQVVTEEPEVLLHHPV